MDSVGCANHRSCCAAIDTMYLVVGPSPHPSYAPWNIVIYICTISPYRPHIASTDNPLIFFIFKEKELFDDDEAARKEKSRELVLPTTDTHQTVRLGGAGGICSTAITYAKTNCCDGALRGSPTPPRIFNVHTFDDTAAAAAVAAEIYISPHYLAFTVCPEDDRPSIKTLAAMLCNSLWAWLFTPARLRVLHNIPAFSDVSLDGDGQHKLWSSVSCLAQQTSRCLFQPTFILLVAYIRRG